MAHIHDVIDMDVHYKIDGVTRTITNIDETKRTLVQYDHNSERLTFEVPRYIDGHDLTTCNRVQVHYINIDIAGKEKNPGIYDIDDIGIKSDDEDVVAFTWLISNNATKYAGTISFLIRFACVDEDGTVDYVWNTLTFKSIFVSDGICNSEIIIENYIDILTQWASNIKSDIMDDVKESITAEDVFYLGGGVDNIGYAENVSDALGELNRAITAVKIIKQDTLFSGKNIKTINGESILGRGDINISGGSGDSNDNYIFRCFITDLYQLEEFEQCVNKTQRDVLVMLEGQVLNEIQLNPGDNLVRTGNHREYTETFEFSFDGVFTYIYVYGNEYKVVPKMDTDGLIFNFNDLINQMNIISNNLDDCRSDVSLLTNVLEYEVIDTLENKVDRPAVIYFTEPELSFEFANRNNNVIRAEELTLLSFTFGNGVYIEDYAADLSFDSGETPTAVDYTDSGILNWVGTDCATSDGLSIFQPSPNTHYDIVFYFNGSQFIGLVNGYVSAIGNEAV